MTTRPRLLAVLLLATTFLVGGLAGMAAEEGLGIDWFDFLDEDFGEGDEDLLRGLQLTNEQRARIQAIGEAEEDRLEAYWEARLPEIRAIVDESYDEIRRELNPEQRAEFDRRVEARGARRPPLEAD